MGSIDFYRNGHHLGTAFKKVRIGKCFAYFPAISLAYQESVVTNFGATPLRFPVTGYQTLEYVSNDLVSLRLPLPLRRSLIRDGKHNFIYETWLGDLSKSLFLHDRIHGEI